MCPVLCYILSFYRQSGGRGNASFSRIMNVSASLCSLKLAVPGSQCYTSPLFSSIFT